VSKDITEIIVDDEKCNGCGICIEKCMMPVLEIIEWKVKVIDVNLCNECGNCERCCPEEAIVVHGKGIMKPWW
jgi:NAD-dependent dihydropyrimidine dehydrogenase PreA subunit